MATLVKRLPNGNLLIPLRVAEDGIIGDGVAEISPGDDGYDRWLAYLEAEERDG